jgi:alkylated DNA nucleotide flippase Atl1
LPQLATTLDVLSDPAGLDLEVIGLRHTPTLSGAMAMTHSSQTITVCHTEASACFGGPVPGTARRSEDRTKTGCDISRGCRVPVDGTAVLTETRLMQDRYAGDVGDFIKLGLLRHLAACRTEHALRVGVNWYFTSDEGHNADGKHIAYAFSGSRLHDGLRSCDPDLMCLLRDVVDRERSVAALEASGALPAGTKFHRAVLHRNLNAPARAAWHRRALHCLRDVDLVFADPDNGIRASGRIATQNKYALLSELADYAERGQSLVVYHHADRSADAATQARRRILELAEAVGQRPVGAIIARRGTCRFFLVTASEGDQDVLGEGLRTFRDRWNSHVDLVRMAADAHRPSGTERAMTIDRSSSGVEIAAIRLAAPASRVRLARMSRLDYGRAEAFMETIPAGRWSSFKDVACAAGNPAAAMAIGNWLRESGGRLPNYWRVIRADRFVPDGLAAHTPGLPQNASAARDRLKQEGVRFSGHRASPQQHYSFDEWRRGDGAAAAAARAPAPARPAGIGLGSTVTLRDLASQEQRIWVLVRSADRDIGANKLSIDSPTAQALLGRAAGDTIAVETPRGQRHYTIERADSG